MPNNEAYKWYKEHHICTICSKNTAMPNRTLCADCAYTHYGKQRLKREQMDEDKKERYQQQKKDSYNRLRAYRKENGLCVKCGKRKSLEGKSLCLDCNIANNRQCRERKIRNGMLKQHELLGECRRCNEKAMPGKHYCEKHYKQVLASLEIANNSPKAIEAKERRRQKNDAFWAEMKYRR